MAARNENEIAVSIPLEDVEKIQIYLNKSRKDAVMMDCGGSSQAYFDHERRQVSSCRKVPHVILIYMKKGK